MPKLGKAGSLQSRQAIVHSLVHTESWAIDLSWVLINIEIGTHFETQMEVNKFDETEEI
jgi:hypothetical protein